METLGYEHLLLPKFPISQTYDNVILRELNPAFYVRQARSFAKLRMTFPAIGTDKRRKIHNAYHAEGVGGMCYGAEASARH